MADAISIQELIDARTDAKTLEEAVNGDAVTTVLSRLGESYPTLANALSQIDGKLDSADAQIKQAITDLFQNGGLPATPFKTKALMTASALVDGDYAMVTEDTDNNGLYVKTAGTWVKSSYDPVSLAVEYATTESKEYVDSKVDISSGNLLLSLEDYTGEQVLLIRDDGGIYVPDLDKSIQESIKTVSAKVDKASSLADYDSSSSILSVKDADGDTVGAITSRGNLIINDVVVSGGSVDKRIANLENNSVSDAKTQILETADRVIASQDKDPYLVQTNITTGALSGVSQVRSPAICRVEKNKYLITMSLGGGGDFGYTDCKGCWLTVNEDYSVTVGEQFEVAMGGTDEFGTYGVGGATILHLNKGLNAGRIYVYFLKRYGETKDVMCHVYSDDMGVSWSEFVDMTPFIPLHDEWRVTLASSKHRFI